METMPLNGKMAHHEGHVCVTVWCLFRSSKKSSECEFFIPAGMHLGDELMRKQDISGKFLHNQYWQANFEPICTWNNVCTTKNDRDRYLFLSFNATGGMGSGGNEKLPPRRIPRVGIVRVFHWHPIQLVRALLRCFIWFKKITAILI